MNKKINSIFIFLGGCVFWLTILQNPVFAQNFNALTGRVTDERGAAVAEATVTLYARESSIRFATVTDKNGAYRFERVTPGNFLIESVANGFGRAAQSIIIENAATTINLTLEVVGPSETVVVTAAGTAQTVDEISKSANVVGQAEIQNRNEIDVIGAMRTIPGFFVRQNGGFGRLATIQTRGLRAQDAAILIDGFRFRDVVSPQGDATSLLADLNITNLDRIEVLRGSGSSLYGTNAVGGVLNVITESGGGAFGGNIETEAGGLGFLRGRAKFAGGAFRNRLNYSAGVSHNNFSRGVDGNDSARNTSGQGKIVVQLGDTAQLSGRIYTGRGFVQLNSSPDVIGANLPPTGIVEARPLGFDEVRRLADGTPVSQLNFGDATFIPDADDPDSTQNSRFFLGNISFTQQPTKDFSYTVSYQNMTTRRRNQNGVAGVGFQPFGETTRGNFDGTIQTFNAKTDFRLGRHNLITAGYEFEAENFGQDNFINNVLRDGTDAKQRSNTVFVQDQLQFLGGRLQLSGAVRAQFFQLSKPKFSNSNSPFANANLENPPTAYTADGSAAYFFRATNTKIRGHIGNGYRIPSLFERFGTFYATFLTPRQFIPLGAPDLEPERSIAVDAGIEQAFLKNRVKFSATYFYTELQNIIFYDSSLFTSPRIFGGYSNTNGGIARGGEFSATLAPTRSTEIFASYTLTRSLQRTPQISGSGINSTLYQPTHQFSVVATQRIGQRLLVNFDFVATDSQLGVIFPTNFFLSSRIYRFDGLRNADLSASYEIPIKNEKVRLRLFGTIENLFDRDYFDAGFRTAGIRGRAGVALSF